jgi:hypothetical protein
MAFWLASSRLKREPNEKEAGQAQVGFYGKPGQFRAGIHETQAQGAAVLGTSTNWGKAMNEDKDLASVCIIVQ